MVPAMDTRILRTILIAAVCGVVGAGAGIAGAGAHEGHGKNRHAKHFNRGFHLGGPVHADLVVPDRKGGFKTVTLDRGTVESVSGDQLTIKEGTPKATYKTITLTIPSAAKIRRNGDAASLSDLQAGDLVSVVTAGDTTFVKARAARDKKKD
jgi:hypothetical protein